MRKALGDAFSPELDLKAPLGNLCRNTEEVLVIMAQSSKEVASDSRGRRFPVRDGVPDP